MIYQLKVTLKQTKPPIWRRLLVDGESTFYQLHHILKVAFDWTDYHLHMFETTKIPEGKEGTNNREYDLFSILAGPVQESAVISNPENEFEWGIFFDEQEEKLADWLQHEKDKITYTYDFGDDWQHEVVLEKILSPEPGAHYPLCVRARHLTPEEDSRGEWLDAEWTADHPDCKLDAQANKELQEEINELLQVENEFVQLQPSLSFRKM